MPNKHNVENVAKIAEELQDITAMWVIDYRGLTVKEVETLRRAVREADAKMGVYKNTLMRLALENAELPELGDMDAVSLARAALDRQQHGMGRVASECNYIEAQVHGPIVFARDVAEIVINKDTAISAGTDEWANSPDGIRFESHSGDTYNAHIMIVRDPSKVYLGTSTENFSTSIPGTRIDDQIETDGAIAGVNAGAFFDNGTSDPAVGSVPEGLVYSKGVCKWTTGSPPNGIKGFAGFNKDNILVVAQDNLSKAQAEELNIRDGCCFGPVLIMNGEINQEAYNSNSGWNPRTAVGQRKDGAVVFVCIDGRQAGSAGGTYKDVIDIMIEYGVVNACNMDGGSSSIMVYRDTYGLFGEAGTVQVINSYSLLQERPRKMPTFWMVAP